MKVVEDIKNILSKHLGQMEIYDLISELDNEEDDMSFAMGDDEMNVVFTNEGHEIELDFTTCNNVNKGVIKISKDEVLKEEIPFEYRVFPNYQAN